MLVVSPVNPNLQTLHVCGTIYYASTPKIVLGRTDNVLFKSKNSNLRRPTKLLEHENLATPVANSLITKITKGNLLTRLFRPLMAAGFVAVTLQSGTLMAQYATNPFTPPSVPDNIKVPEGNTLFLVPVQI
jgi:hypothetical protein